MGARMKPKRKHPEKDLQTKKQFAEDWANGIFASELQRKYDLTQWQLYLFAKKLGVRRPHGFQGARNNKHTSEVRARRAASLRRPLRVRFERHYLVEPNSGCWLWDGAVDRRGYGQLRCTDRLYYATHISMMLRGHTIPPGHYVCHKCDVPSCVNPDHLFIGTPKDNSQDSIRKGRNSPPPIFYGEKCRFFKFSDETIKAVREDFINGAKLREVSAKYGMSIIYASAIKNHKVRADA